jgi:hypothetical protein
MNAVADGIYAPSQDKLRPLNIEIKYIEGKCNVAANGLSRAIFSDDCSLTDATTRLAEELARHRNDRKDNFVCVSW